MTREIWKVGISKTLQNWVFISLAQSRMEYELYVGEAIIRPNLNTIKIIYKTNYQTDFEEI